MDSLTAMRVFARVVETGSFSAAGRQLGQAPSSVSRLIGDLEYDLGARLFHRTTRRLSLTEAGHVYHARALGILRDLEDARLAVSELTDAPSGILRMTLPASLAARHLVPAIAGFRARYPAVTAAVSVTDRLVDLVEDGFDLAVRIGRLTDSSLVARKIGTADRLLAASPAYLKQNGAPQTPDDLHGHSCLVVRDQPGANAWAFDGASGRQVVRVSGAFVANDGPSLVAAAAAGLGIVAVPRWLIGAELKRRQLKPVLTEYTPDPADTPLHAVYPHQRHLPPKVRVFIDFLANRFGRERAWAVG